MTRTIARLSVLFFIVGCAHKVVQPPKVELESINVTDPTLTAATFVFGLRVDNPNSFSLRVQEIDYDLDINDKDFTTGSFEPRARVPAKDRSVVEIPMRISYLTLLQSLTQIAESQKLGYKLKGTVKVSGVEVPFDLGGDLPIPGRTQIRTEQGAE